MYCLNSDEESFFLNLLNTASLSVQFAIYLLFYVATINFSHQDPKELNKIINQELKVIQDYFNANSLCISIEETAYMICCPKRGKKPKLEIKIGDKIIEEKYELIMSF